MSHRPVFLPMRCSPLPPRGGQRDSAQAAPTDFALPTASIRVQDFENASALADQGEVVAGTMQCEILS